MLGESFVKNAIQMPKGPNRNLVNIKRFIKRNNFKEGQNCKFSYH